MRAAPEFILSLPREPMGVSVYALPDLFAAFRRLRPGPKTRYGWVASPCPTGTFTLQEMPSLARRDNVPVQERTARRAVRCNRSLAISSLDGTNPCCALPESLDLCTAVRCPIKYRKVLQDRRHIGMVGTERHLPDRHDAA